MAGQLGATAAAQVEILIHVTAPSRVSDDVTYRRLAEAYLSFAPGHAGGRTYVTVPAASLSSPGHHNHHHHNGDDVAAWQPLCSDSLDMSFQSVLHNKSSPWLDSRPAHPASASSPPPPPRHALVAAEEDAVPATPTTAAAAADDDDLPSEIADSYPMPDSALFNVTPTRVLQKYMGDGVPASAPEAVVPVPTCSPMLSRADVDEEEPILKMEPSTADDALASIGSSLPSAHEMAMAQGYEALQLEQIIPETPHLPGTARKRKTVEDGHADQTLIWDTTHVSSSTSSGAASSTAAPQRPDSAPPSVKRARLDTHTSAILQLARSHSDNTASRPEPPLSSTLSHVASRQVASMHNHPSSSSSSSSSSSPSSSSTSLTIRPPPPPVSVASLEPSSLVSDKLGKLADDLSSRYRPTAHRSLAPLERGFWLVDCARWTPAVRADAWAFLTSYIRSGLAGWAVWCRRSPGPDHARLRLYGWAHVAKHLYLLLYLASGRQIKVTGARWLDARGVVALEVVP